MGGLSVAEIKQAVPAVSLSLEELLLQMQAHGQPRVSLISNGWFCAIDMYVGAEGAEFAVKSEFNFDTPTAAAQQCMERLRAALKTIGAGNVR